MTGIYYTLGKGGGSFTAKHSPHVVKCHGGCACDQEEGRWGGGWRMGVNAGAGKVSNSVISNEKW